MILGRTSAGEPLGIDLQRLIGSHACVVANSGGGKSTLIRRLVEISHGQVQQIILDPEDEFYTLRERCEFVVAGGDGGDIPASVDAAPALALAALQHGFSLIVQLNDLGEDAPAFVGDFLGALISAPRDLWRPLLVIIDETHRFAPGQSETAATHGVRALAGQGRKRGFTGIFASQRITKIDPNVRGDVNNWLLGRVGQSLDRRAVADALGFAPSSAEARNLQGLADCNFWGFGPAIAREPVLFKVDDPETTRVRPGDAKLPTPPAPEALRSILAGLASPPPAETQKHIVAGTDGFHLSDYDTADLIDELERRDPEWLKSHDEFRAAIQDRDAWMAKANRFDGQIKAAIRALGVRPIDEIADEIEDRRWADGLKRIPATAGEGGSDHVDRSAQRAAPLAPEPRQSRTAGRDGAQRRADRGSPSESGLTGPQGTFLGAIRWWQAIGHPQPTKAQVAAICGWRITSGHIKNVAGSLRSAKLIDYPAPGRFRLTSEGLSLAPEPDASLTLHDQLRSTMTGPQRAVFDLLLVQGQPLDRAALASALGWEPTSGHVKNVLGSMRTLELLDYPSPGVVALQEWVRSDGR